MPARFDDIEIGQVASLGATSVEPEALAAFAAAFAPGWTLDRGAPDAMIYALWAKLDALASERWPQTKRIGVDALRWMRNPPAGELIRGRMTIMGKDAVGEDKRHRLCPARPPGRGRPAGLLLPDPQRLRAVAFFPSLA